MQKVYADFQRLNKQMLVASKFSFSVANYSHKPHKQYQMKAAVHGIRWFNWALHHQVA